MNILLSVSHERPSVASFHLNEVGRVEVVTEVMRGGLELGRECKVRV